jgi:multidrug efflux pump subunit AcrA (membrane-fusion protein)
MLTMFSFLQNRITVLAGIIFAIACGLAPASSAQNAAPVPVLATQVQRTDVQTFITGLGTVRAYNSVILTSRVDGQIVKINFSEGQEVHLGDVLVEIDPLPFEAALAQAEAAKLKDTAMLGNARLDLERAQNWSETAPERRNSSTRPAPRWPS